MNARLQIRLALLGIGTIAGLLWLCPSHWQPLPARAGATATSAAAVRNLIVLIPNGCSQSLITLARWSRGGPLAVDSIQTGAVKTHSANSLVSDDDAAATALASGVKTANGLLGVAPPPDAPFRLIDLPYASGQPLATLLEGAKRSGRSVGLVTTANLGDATPAAFAAHTMSGLDDEQILTQMAHQNLDVVLGGGRQRLIPVAAGGTRTDGRNLLEVLRAHGVQLVDNRSALAQVKTGQVWGLFAPGSLAPEIDRAARAPDQPSLAQMTAKAINLLKQNRQGFCLLVAASQIEPATRANDPARAVREFLAFDEAVTEALAFATGAGQGQTLVIACPDHDIGGLSIGQRTHTPQTVAELVTPLADMQMSAAALSEKISAERSAANIAANVEAWWNMRLTPAVAAELTNRVALGWSLEYALGEVISRQCTAIGWTSSGSTGVDVPLWSYGPGRPTGLLDNTEIAWTAARALRLDLPALTRTQFVDAQKVFPNATLDTTDARNPALVIGTARLPINQNRLILNGKEQRFDGVVVHIEKTGRTYLPKQAQDLITR